ncbi:hypothetical protein EAF00_001846 [Botryotinia globosa]|nr:hypothetical protein EAF00_001846 [Botryotinia globosa]
MLVLSESSQLTRRSCNNTSRAASGLHQTAIRPDSAMSDRLSALLRMDPHTQVDERGSNGVITKCSLEPSETYNDQVIPTLHQTIHAKDNIETFSGNEGRN